MSYAAMPATAPRIDLGPEWTPEQSEARQTMERGMQAFLAVARQPRDPFHPPDQSQLRRYQESFQELAIRSPDEASELAHQAGNVAQMAERYQGRRSRLSRHLGLGYVIVPGPDPGFTLLDMAWSGVPRRHHPRGW